MSQTYLGFDCCQVVDVRLELAEDLGFDFASGLHLQAFQFLLVDPDLSGAVQQGECLQDFDQTKSGAVLEQ